MVCVWGGGEEESGRAGDERTDLLKYLVCISVMHYVSQLCVRVCACVCAHVCVCVCVSSVSYCAFTINFV